MDQIDDDFIAVMTEQGATDEKLISLERVGPPMVAKGHDLENVYQCLMRLIRDKKVVHVGESNAVRFS